MHLAALSNDPLGNLDPDLTYDINHLASVRLAELAKAAGVKRFVFSSSCSTYGAAGDAFLDETAPLNPVTPMPNPRSWSSATLRRWRTSISARPTCEMRPRTECLRACGWISS